MNLLGILYVLGVPAVLRGMPAAGARTCRSARRFVASGGRSMAFTLLDLLVVIGIIAIAATLLFPALAAAREKSRRASCMSNLHQLGAGLESYCSEYRGYLPCWPGYGFLAESSVENPLGQSTLGSISTNGQAAPSLGAVNFTGRIGGTAYSCVMNALTTGATIAADEPLRVPPWGATSYTGDGITVTPAFPGTNYFRTCFIGSPAGANITGGSCFTGPVGLGNLLSGGFVKDAKILICPSAKGMPWDAGAMYAGDSLTDLRTLFGRTGLDDQNVMMMGDWVSLAANKTGSMTGGCWQSATCSGTGNHPVYGFQSSYNYRNVPISAAGNTALWPGNNTYCPGGNINPNFGATTKPPLMAWPGCPQFKVEKMLMMRSVVSDTFSKWDGNPAILWSAASPISKPIQKNMSLGYGTWAHKDGYNVLYGDWHAEWKGDPTQRIMNWTNIISQSTSSPIPVDQAEISASIAAIAYATAETTSGPVPLTTSNTAMIPQAYPNNYAFPALGFQIWHYFDTNGGWQAGF